jgi:hypothetical protein
MRTVIVVLIALVLGGLFLIQKQREHLAVVAQAEQQAAAKGSPTPRPVSEHNWAKHSLDKTRSVMSQVAEKRKADGVTGR